MERWTSVVCEVTQVRVEGVPTIGLMSRHGRHVRRFAVPEPEGRWISFVRNANIRSVGAAGSPHAAFQRALRNRNLTRALTEARDLPVVNLADALDLVLLLGDQRPDRYGRAAARWLGRYILELRHVDLIEAQLVAAALAGLRAQDPRPAAQTLRSLTRRRRMTDIETVLTRWLQRGPVTSAQTRRSPATGR